MVLCGVAWYCMVLNGIVCYCIALHCILCLVWDVIALYCLVWYCIVLFCIAWFCIAWHGILWCCLVLQYIAYYWFDFWLANWRLLYNIARHLSDLLYGFWIICLVSQSFACSEIIAKLTVAQIKSWVALSSLVVVVCPVSITWANMPIYIDFKHWCQFKIITWWWRLCHMMTTWWPLGDPIVTTWWPFGLTFGLPYDVHTSWILDL